MGNTYTLEFMGSFEDFDPKIGNSSYLNGYMKLHE